MKNGGEWFGVPGAAPRDDNLFICSNAQLAWRLCPANAQLAWRWHGMALAPGKRPTCMALAPGKRATRMALVPGKRATGMALASRIVSRVITCRSRQACLLLYQGE
jgi:hypothetical protein